MRATLHEIYSTDVDLETYAPDDPQDAGLWVTMVVGPQAADDDEAGEETFQVLVCTPRWLSRTVADRGPQVGRHHLVVEPFDLARAEEFLRGQVESLDEADWPALAERVGRIGRWEFEDYRE